MNRRMPVTSVVSNFVTLWAIAHQAFLSLGFFRHEYWSGLLCPPPGDLPHPGIQPLSISLLHWQAGSLPLPLAPGEPVKINISLSAFLYNFTTYEYIPRQCELIDVFLNFIGMEWYPIFSWGSGFFQSILFMKFIHGLCHWRVHSFLLLYSVLWMNHREFIHLAVDGSWARFLLRDLYRQPAGNVLVHVSWNDVHEPLEGQRFSKWGLGALQGSQDLPGECLMSKLFS